MDKQERDRYKAIILIIKDLFMCLYIVQLAIPSKFTMNSDNNGGTYPQVFHNFVEKFWEVNG